MDVLDCHYINTESEILQLVSVLSEERIIAVDFEFDRDHYAYGFNICLIQIATSANVYVIDPIELGPSYSSLFSIFSNPGITKVFCSCKEDIKLLTYLNCNPENIVDIEVYARLLNFEKSSLGGILNTVLGLELDKKLQKVNWLKRPLSQDQISYAANDVIYLLRLNDILYKQVKSAGLLEFAQQENTVLGQIRFQNEEKRNPIKTDDLKQLSEQEVYVLTGLYQFREELAKKINKPAHFLIAEVVMREIVTMDQLTVSDTGNLVLHYYLKTVKGAQELIARISELKKEALHLSNQPSWRPLTYEEKQQISIQKQKHSQDKMLIFKPIQELLATRFGKNAATFILSGNMVDTIIKDKLTIGQLNVAYKQKLFSTLANELNIDLKDYA